MVVDDSTYITPHEAALAVEATSMKKARMQLDVLVLNSVIAGIVFSTGGILNIAIHSDNPDMWNKDPGLLDFLSGIFYGTGLFYVVILGVDLYNSNILYFSVGILRRSVNIYDLLISWFCSLIGNLGGSLLVSYVFIHLSSVSSSHLWKVGSRRLVEGKASFSFIETFLKGIGGNFFVSLAIYLQLMAKPLHVKWFLTILPVFTFVSIGFTHVVADMSLAFIGMLNGGKVSVGKYIWKLLIPAAVGNMLGGVAFSLIVPFYLHLVVVERDRKKLSLPQYGERDEQPELNMDSRVVRVRPEEEQYEEEQAEEAEEENRCNEKDHEVPSRNSIISSRSTQSSALAPNQLSRSISPTFLDRPQALEDNSAPIQHVGRCESNRSNVSFYSAKSAGLRKRLKNTPPGVFPVRGMTNRPRETDTGSQKVTDYFTAQDQPFEDSNPRLEGLARRDSLMRGSTTRLTETNENSKEDYNVLDSKPGNILDKVVSRFVTRMPSRQTNNELPRTLQDVFPYNQPPSSNSTQKQQVSRLRSTSLTSAANAIGRRSSATIPKAKTLSIGRNSKFHQPN